MRDGWVETTLGEVAHVNPEVTKGWSSERTIRYIDLSSVAAGSGIDSSAVGEFSYGDAPGRARRVVRCDDVLVATVRPYLRGFAHVGHEWDGAVASTGFAVLRALPEMAMPEYVWACVRGEPFVEHLMALATGSNYPAVRPDDVASFRIALPSLAEQRRIVDLIQALDDQCRAADAVARSGDEALRALADQLLHGVNASERALGDCVELNPKEGPLSPTDPFVPMDAVEAGGRWIRYAEPRGSRGGARARGGDTLFARITPCLENGKIGQVPLAVDRVGGSTEFIVLRARPGLLPDYLFYLARSDRIRRQAEALMTGTTGRQRVSAQDLAAISVRMPPVEMQQQVVDLLAAADDTVTMARSVARGIGDVRHSVLDELLKGDHEIPASYDAILEAVA